MHKKFYQSTTKHLLAAKCEGFTTTRWIKRKKQIISGAKDMSFDKDITQDLTSKLYLL